VRRGLPGSVAAQEPERLTPCHVEGQIPDDGFVPEIHPEILDVHKCFAHGYSPKMCWQMRTGSLSAGPRRGAQPGG
jgi:hypothetical protein